MTAELLLPMSYEAVIGLPEYEPAATLEIETWHLRLVATFGRIAESLVLVDESSGGTAEATERLSKLHPGATDVSHAVALVGVDFMRLAALATLAAARLAGPAP